MQMLIKSIKDSDGDTAIEWALYHNQYDIANHLKFIRRKI